MKIIPRLLPILMLLCCISASAAEPFATYFGRYKIASCQFSVNAQPVAHDPECDYDRIEVGPDAQGVVYVTRFMKAGSFVGEPVSLFDRTEGRFHDEAHFTAYGDYQVWTHSFSHPDGGLSETLEITSFIFNRDAKGKLTYSVSYHVSGRHGTSESLRVFDLLQD